MFVRSQFWMVVVLLVTICPIRAHGRSAQGQAAVAGTEPVQKPVAQDPNYVIGPQDVLDISVWKENELTRTVPVRPDGKISMPLLNDVRAAGLTPNAVGRADHDEPEEIRDRSTGHSHRDSNQQPARLHPW